MRIKGVGLHKALPHRKCSVKLSIPKLYILVIKAVDVCSPELLYTFFEEKEIFSGGINQEFTDTYVLRRPNEVTIICQNGCFKWEKSLNIIHKYVVTTFGRTYEMNVSYCFRF